MVRGIDTLARHLAPAVGRRTLFGLLAGGTAGSIFPALASTGIAGKKRKKKGKGKKQNKKK